MPLLWREGHVVLRAVDERLPPSRDSATWMMRPPSKNLPMTHRQAIAEAAGHANGR